MPPICTNSRLNLHIVGGKWQDLRIATDSQFPCRSRVINANQNYDNDEK